jgi:hypothetical protein
MRVEIKTICDVSVYEAWQVNVPDGLAGDDLRGATSRRPEQAPAA